MQVGWFRRRLRELDRSWWYIGFAYAQDNRMVCSGMIYTLTTPHFVMPAILRDLEKRLKSESVTILSWQQLNPAEGANLAKYFQARLDEMAARAGAPKAPHLALVKMPAEE